MEVTNSANLESAMVVCESGVIVACFSYLTTVLGSGPRYVPNVPHKLRMQLSLYANISAVCTKSGLDYEHSSSEIQQPHTKPEVFPNKRCGSRNVPIRPPLRSYI